MLEAPPVRLRSLVALFCAATAFYVASISRNLALAHDSIGYINDLDAGIHLFHQHHLLYHVTAFGWLRLWQALGVRAPSEVIVAALNSVFGGLTLCALYLFARRRLRLAPGASMLALGLCGFSFGFWFYSAVVEVYLPALFFMVCAAYVLAADELTPKRMAQVGLLHALGTLYHQLNILFVLVVAVILLARARRRWWRMAFSYGAALVPTVGIPYILIPVLFEGVRSVSGYLYWITFYAHLGYWCPLTLETLAKACVGSGRAVLGSHFLMAVPPIRDRILASFGHNFLSDELYLVRSLTPSMGAWLLGAWLLTLGCTLVTALVALGRWRTVWAAHGRAMAPILLWLAVYSCFFVFWVPDNPEFWIPQSVCGWLLLVALCRATGADPGGRVSWARSVLPRLVLVLLTTVNLLGSMLWVRGTEYDYYYGRAQALAGQVRKGDLLVLGQEWVWGPYVRRFVAPDPMSLEMVLDSFPRAEDYVRRVALRVNHTLERGGRVILSREAVEFKPETARQRGPGLLAVERLWDGYRGSWRRVEMPLDTVYVISAAAARPAP
jgi:hypothetical protein